MDESQNNCGKNPEKEHRLYNFIYIKLQKMQINLQLQKAGHRLLGVGREAEGIMKRKPFKCKRYVHYLHCGDGFMGVTHLNLSLKHFICSLLCQLYL